MKLKKFVLTLTAAALLPAFAYAGTDPVTASFERDMVREPVEIASVAGNLDAFTTEFYIALNGTDDPVLASFDRDMYRAPNAVITIGGEPDVLTAEFYAALRDVIGKFAMRATGNRIDG